MRCPTSDDLTIQALALLPRGRAWRSHRQGPEETSVIGQYWRSVAEVFAFMVQRVCQLRLEFWCQTMSETEPEWLVEYGLPDLCDPFPDLCTKVSAIGGTRCEYYAEVAERAGWSIACGNNDNICGAQAGCAQAGCSFSGNLSYASRLLILVYLGESPSYVAGYLSLPFAGCMMAGQQHSCPPDISSLQCVLDRVVHAHIEIEYRIVPPPTYLMIADHQHLSDEFGNRFVT